MKLYDEYSDMLDRGEYDSVEELCNLCGLNLDEVYDYEEEEDEW